MIVVRSKAQPEMIHVLLTDQDAINVRAALRSKTPFARKLRRELKKVLK